MRIDTRHEPHISKKACRNCGHGIAIHYPHRVKGTVISTCNHPDCRCKKYVEPKA